MLTDQEYDDLQEKQEQAKEDKEQELFEAKQRYIVFEDWENEDFIKLVYDAFDFGYIDESIEFYNFIADTLEY